jgi:ribulose-phosphate 3-epimerase
MAADMLNLEKDLIRAQEAGADSFHVDIMDGNYVPNITFGVSMVETINKFKNVNVPMDVHLMVERPEDYIEPLAKAGAHGISVHLEGNPHIHRLLTAIKSYGVQAGVAINPGTPLIMVEPLLDVVDYVAVMSVNPGFCGQKFIKNSLDKIARLIQIRAKKEHYFEILVDGGIDEVTGSLVKAAGADTAVSGAFVFNGDLEKNLAILKGV